MNRLLPLLLVLFSTCFSMCAAADLASAILPDGRLSAHINAEDELWIADSNGQAQHLLLGPQSADDPKRNLTGFNNPAFSPDGRAVYVMTTAWVTSNALQRVELATGVSHFVSAANDFEILPTGPYAGKLLVLKHTYLPHGASQGIWFLITPEGRVIRKIGDESTKAQFLAKQIPNTR